MTSATATTNGQHGASGAARPSKAAYESAEAKPPTLPVNPDGIPAELKALPQWVCWRWYRKPDRQTGKRTWSKLPVNARTTRPAESDNPETWATFQEAWKRYDRQRDRYDGISFMITDPYTGVDLDEARDARTGDLDPWAAELLAELGTYAEVSPTQTGVKALVKARKPGKRCKAPYAGGEVEIYDHARFWTMTGHALPGSPAEIPERQQALDAVYRRVFAERAKSQAGPEPQRGNGRAGTRFKWEGFGGECPLPLTRAERKRWDCLRASKTGCIRALWGGDISAYRDDDSRADQALVNFLYVLTNGDRARVEQLFGESPLGKRPKWTDRADYRKRTLDKAAAWFQGWRDDPAQRRRRKKRRKGERKGKDRGARPAPPPETAPDLDNPEAEPLDTVQTIRAYWQREYDFSFRRGNDLYSRRLGAAVRRSDACFAPDSELVELLLQATDAPEDGRDGIHRHFREWAKTAWKDEWKIRPEEAASGELIEVAREEFRALVRAGLLTPKTLSVGKLRSGEETNVQNKPLLHFARSFAVTSRWADVRGLCIWSKKGPHSPDVPRVAVRVEVFGQVGFARLAGMPYEKFATLCELYDVGKRAWVRGKQDRAVELLPEFVAEALAVPLDDPAEGPQPGHPDGERSAGARPREEASERPGSEEVNASQ